LILKFELNMLHMLLHSYLSPLILFCTNFVLIDSYLKDYNDNMYLFYNSIFYILLDSNFITARKLIISLRILIAINQ